LTARAGFLILTRLAGDRHHAAVPDEPMFFFKRRKRETFGQNFKRFFFRGLAILLPTILTVWLLIAAYNFLDRTIARIERVVRPGTG